MIPFVIKSLYFSDIDLKYPPTEARLYSLISASWTWDSYHYKYYLYNCLVYGINPRSEIFRVNKRWWFFNSEIPTGSCYKQEYLEKYNVSQVSTSI